MVSRFLRCCFPNNKETITVNNDFNFNNQAQSDDIHTPINAKQHADVDLIKFAAHLESETNISNNSKQDDSKEKPKQKIAENVIDQEVSTKQSQINKNQIINKPIKHPTKVSFVEDKDLSNNNYSINHKDEIVNNEKFESDSSSKKEIKLNKITETEEQNFPKITLKSIVGDAFNNEELVITSAGLKTSLRGARDSVTFFGCRQTDNTIDKMIDYELNISNSNISQVYSSILFLIYFKKDMKRFYIKSYIQNKDSSNIIPNVIIQITEPYVSYICYTLVYKIKRNSYVK